MAQIINITSEALQATIRRLLPSQQGFGEDLQASNVITPIIDLTPSAEGSDVPVQLQEAFFAGQASEFIRNGGTVTLVNTPGFWRVNYSMTARNSGSNQFIAVQINDGTTITKLVQTTEGFNPSGYALQGILTVFLQTGESIELFSDISASFIAATARQIADVNGTLVNPTGFTPQ